MVRPERRCRRIILQVSTRRVTVFDFMIDEGDPNKHQHFQQ